MKHLILLLILCTCAYGQNPNEPIVIEVRVLALGSALDMPERFLRTKKAYEKISFSNRVATEIIEAYSDERLPIFAKANDPQSESEFRIAEQVKLPDNAKSILLLCWSTPESELRYLAINDSILAAGYNNWLMINTTPTLVGFRIGENTKPVFLKPNSIVKQQITADKGEGVPVVGRVELNGGMQSFYSTYWRIREDERSILIFSKVGNKIKVTRIGDRLMKKKDDGLQTE